MAVRADKCPDCGLKRGHKPGCARAAACPHCGSTVGHAQECPNAYNNRQERKVAPEEGRSRRARAVVDGQDAEVVLDGATGGPVSSNGEPHQQTLIEVSIDELLDTLATETAIRQRYANERDRWGKRVKNSDDNIAKIVKALQDRGHLKKAIMQRLDVELPPRED